MCGTNRSTLQKKCMSKYKNDKWYKIQVSARTVVLENTRSESKKKNTEMWIIEKSESLFFGCVFEKSRGVKILHAFKKSSLWVCLFASFYILTSIRSLHLCTKAFTRANMLIWSSDHPWEEYLKRERKKRECLGKVHTSSSPSFLFLKSRTVRESREKWRSRLCHYSLAKGF